MGKQIVMALDQPAFVGLTYRDVLEDALDRDWNLRRDILEARSGDSVRLTLRVDFDLTAELAKMCLRELKRKEAEAEAKE